MEDNKPYDHIRQSLEHEGLQPGDKDWSDMEALLDQHLPVSAPAGQGVQKATALVKPVTLFVLTAVCVLTAVLYKYLHNNSATGSGGVIAHTSDNSAARGEALQDTTLSLQSVQGAGSVPGTGISNDQPGLDSVTAATGSGNTDQQQGDLLQQKQVNASVTRGGGLANNLQRTGHAKDKGLGGPGEQVQVNKAATGKGSFYPSKQRTNNVKQKKLPVNPGRYDQPLSQTAITTKNDLPGKQNAKPGGGKPGLKPIWSEGEAVTNNNNAYMFQPGSHAGNGANPFADSIGSITSAGRQNAMLLVKPSRDIATGSLPASTSQSYTLSRETAWKATQKTGKNAGSEKSNNNKSALKKSDLKGSAQNGFSWGLQLAPLQFNLANGSSNQAATFNIVPGMFGKINLSSKINVGAELVPLVKNGLSNALYYSTASTTGGDSSGTDYTRTHTSYAAGAVTTFKGGIHLNYQLSDNLSAELGLGVLLPLKLKVTKTDSSYSISGTDSSFTGSTSVSTNIKKSDPSFANINHSIPYADFTLWYTQNKFSLGVGYQQNLKGWFQNTTPNPAGKQFHITLRYRFR
ncbi:MAG TPA: hypothetical protein PKM63_14485 [Panacibacter sp.]|nr:hypothetical protein [Panacibacter sp.]HNP45495.1 hypothetical protein [Panacibacter sp.]